MHSEDLVRTFYNIGSQEGNLDEAAFIRLQENRQGELEAITYDMARMESALELDLEIR